MGEDKRKGGEEIRRGRVGRRGKKGREREEEGTGDRDKQTVGERKWGGTCHRKRERGGGSERKVELREREIGREGEEGEKEGRTER